MRKKDELYKNEQDEIINNIIDLLNLDNIDYILLHDLDNDINKQNKILYMIPIIRKYFSFTSINGVSKPDKTKRSYLSIIKQLLKNKYKIKSYDHRIKENDNIIRTKKYIFEKLL